MAKNSLKELSHARLWGAKKTNMRFAIYEISSYLCKSLCAVWGRNHQKKDDDETNFLYSCCGYPRSG